MGTPNSINLASLDGSVNFTAARGLNPSFTGAVDTAALLFTVADVPGLRVFASTNLNNGTIAIIRAPGVYKVDLSVTAQGAVATACGIGVNMVASPIVADPVIGTDGVIKATDNLGVAAFAHLIELSTVIYVTAAQAAASLTVHFLCTNSAGAAPAGLDLVFTAFRVQQLAQVSF